MLHKHVRSSRRHVILHFCNAKIHENYCKQLNRVQQFLPLTMPLVYFFKWTLHASTSMRQIVMCGRISEQHVLPDGCLHAVIRRWFSCKQLAYLCACAKRLHICERKKIALQKHLDSSIFFLNSMLHNIINVTNRNNVRCEWKRNQLWTTHQEASKRTVMSYTTFEVRLLNCEQNSSSKP